MTLFTATNESADVVAAARADIWAVLVDPVLLARLTPILRRIDTDGDLWRWQLARIAALGVSINPRFTERMRFDEGRRIEFVHEAPSGTAERTSADGWYELSDVDGDTRLTMSLTLHAELPLPKAAGPAVRRIMTATMQHTGDRFATNLCRHLGVTKPRRAA